MKPLEIFLTDLFYFNRQTNTRLCVPLNIGYIASYAKRIYGKAINISMFKDINALLKTSKSVKPDILGMSFYYWNTNLNLLALRELRGEHKRSFLTVFGGPSIDSTLPEQNTLLAKYPEVDVFIPYEGEMGFSNLVSVYLEDPGNVLENPIDGCFFGKEGEIIKGSDCGLSLRLSTLPSPYLSGDLDYFLANRYLPLLQASRMCPYGCTFCVAGKDQGKLRAFPIEQVKAEIDYVAQWHKHNPHLPFYLAELNFGINEQDPDLAEYIKKTSRDIGYPKSVYFYNDKRFTNRAKDVIEKLGDINRDGLVFSLQSENLDTLESVKRKNLSDEDIAAGIEWAKKRNIPVSTELIFGLPYETLDSAVRILDKSIKKGFDSILLHNLLLMDGIELSRKENRKKFDYKTKYRLLGSNYSKINETFVAEVEEIAVGNKFFTFDDFMTVRKMNLMFFSVFQGHYYKYFFHFMKDRGIPLAQFFADFMNPSPDHEWPIGYLEFVTDFNKAAINELYFNIQDLFADAQAIYEKENDVGKPIRLNPFYFSRLLYMKENWIKPVLIKHLELKTGSLDSPTLDIAENILDLCANLIVDLREPNNRNVLETRVDYISWQQGKFEESFENFRSAKKEVHFRLNSYRLKMIEAFRIQNHTANDVDFSYSAVETIFPRTNLYYDIVYE